MELVVKHFSELTAKELFEIYKLRVSVFVVEQKCPYQEVDDADRTAYHLWLKDADGIEAYARVLPQGAAFPTAAIGRNDFHAVSFPYRLRQYGNPVGFTAGGPFVTGRSAGVGKDRLAGRQHGRRSI